VLKKKEPRNYGSMLDVETNRARVRRLSSLDLTCHSQKWHIHTFWNVKGSEM